MVTPGHLGDDPAVLSRLPPGPTQVRFAVLVILVLVAALAVAVPFARIPLPGSSALLPAYATTVTTNELITAALLFALYAIEGSAAVGVLAAGYLGSSLLVIAWLLTFPGVFAADGLLGSDIQSTAVLAALRRVGFPAMVLLYAILKDRPPSADAGRAARPPITVVAATVVAVVAGVTWLAVAGDGVLPTFMADTHRAAPLWAYVPGSAVVLCVVALLRLGRGRRSVLDLWLMVVMTAWLIETLLLGLLSSGRFSLGWWAGRVYGLAAASTVLVVLLAETTALYTRLARSIAAERRAREARLLTLEAVSASIAHEVNQPLAGMVTNAEAGLRWLRRPAPDLGEAAAALERIVADGHRTAKVVRGIRAVFRKRPERCKTVDVARLVHDAVQDCWAELQANQVAIGLVIDPALPPVAGDPVQLRQVLVNLVTNAVDAMAAASRGNRKVTVSARLDGAGAVLLSVEDTGPGLDAEEAKRVFEPFFTTKSHGMGMGLMICRSIVETHGGRLWLEHGAGQGAAFRVTLPLADVVSPG